jgi:hypothetical protein
MHHPKTLSVSQQIALRDQNKIFTIIRSIYALSQDPKYKSASRIKKST